MTNAMNVNLGMNVLLIFCLCFQRTQPNKRFLCVTFIMAVVLSVIVSTQDKYVDVFSETVSRFHHIPSDLDFIFIFMFHFNVLTSWSSLS